MILLIDDKEETLYGNEYMLKRRGYEVITALTLREARERMNESEPDAIILDIMLPDGNGLDFMRSLRQKSQIPVLLLTGLTTPEDIVRGLAVGGDDYLTKPYDFSVLQAGASGFYDIYIGDLPNGIYPIMIEAKYEYPGTAQLLLAKELPFILTVTDGKIVSVNTNGDNKITEISFEVNQSAHIMIGFYNGDKLINIIRKPVAVSGLITGAIDIPADANKIKIMIWDDNGNMKPLCAPLSIDKGSKWPLVTAY